MSDRLCEDENDDDDDNDDSNDDDNDDDMMMIICETGSYLRQNRHTHASVVKDKHSALHSRVFTCMWVECWEREIDSGPLAHRNLVLLVRFQLELFSDAQAARPLRSLLNPHLSLDSCFPSPVLLGTGETKGPRSLCGLQLWAQPRAVRGRLDPRGCCTGYQAG